jgi:integrase
MGRKKLSTPSYRKHASGQATVRLNGKDHYLGPHGTKVSRDNYDELILRWLAGGRRLPPTGADATLTINELIVAYVKHADTYYVKEGEPTSEPKEIKLSLRPLRRLYGTTLAADFGRAGLSAVQDAMIEAGLSRGTINRRLSRVKRAFRWAHKKQLIPETVYPALLPIEGLKEGRSKAKETDPVLPVPDHLVDGALPFMSRQVGAMVRLQWLTAMRPGEAVRMRTGEINRTKSPWEFKPGRHKMQHKGRGRTIYLGPLAQEVVAPFLRADPNAFIFSPANAVAEQNERRTAGRKTRVQPSQQNRAKRKPRKQPGARYTVNSYRKAVFTACERAFPHPELAKIQAEHPPAVGRRAWRKEQRERVVRWTRENADALASWRAEHSWSPGQLRHNAATRLRSQYGLEVASIILGHKSPAITLIYAEADLAKAADVMAKTG